MHPAPCPPTRLAANRRHFFRDCGVGLGSVALASLLNKDAARPPTARRSSPSATRT